MSVKTISASIDAMLKPLGFQRQRTVWNRHTEFTVEVADVQVSKNGDLCTLNVGVLDKEVYEIFWGIEPPNFVEQPLCTVSARIGELIRGRDLWWPVGELAADYSQITQAIEAILSFFDQLNSRQGMVRWLTDSGVTRKRYPPPIINLAILHALIGQFSKSEALFNDLQSGISGPWLERIIEARDRLGVKSGNMT